MDCAGAECATIEVPLDYDDPSLGRVELSVTVVPATGEAIGSLVVNPGGPGESAIDYARAADYVLGKPVREVYNIVGIDPRGVGLSDPIRCLSDRQIDELTAADGTPDSADEIATIDREAVIPAQECSDSQDALAARMGTLNVARDFDIVRAVLDEPVLNMLGKSYGTAIATAYIALFPEHAGRMVLDGVLATDRNAVEVTFDQAVEALAAIHFLGARGAHHAIGEQPHPRAGDHRIDDAGDLDLAEPHLSDAGGVNQQELHLVVGSRT